MIFPAFGPSLHARPCPRADGGCIGFSAACGTLSARLRYTSLRFRTERLGAVAVRAVTVHAVAVHAVTVHAVRLGAGLATAPQRRSMLCPWTPRKGAGAQLAKGNCLVLDSSLLRAGSHSPASGTVFFRRRQSSRVKRKNCHISWGLGQELKTTPPPQLMGQDKSKASSDSQGRGRNPASLWQKSQSVCPLLSSAN